jgi:hypothetical protein
VRDESVPRTLDAAVKEAIARGVVAAAKGEGGRAEYTAVREQLEAYSRAWSWSSGVNRPAPVEETLGRFRAAVKAQLAANGAAASATVGMPAAGAAA